MSISAATLLFAAQFQGICTAGALPQDESGQIETVRAFIELGNRQDYESASRYAVADAVGIDVNGDQFLLADAINSAAETGNDHTPILVLEVMAVPDSVVVKAAGNGDVGLVLFKLQGGCIFLVSYL